MPAVPKPSKGVEHDPAAEPQVRQQRPLRGLFPPFQQANQSRQHARPGKRRLETVMAELWEAIVHFFNFILEMIKQWIFDATV